MAYWKDVWEFTNSKEYEYKYAGKYGAKGEKRGKRKKATPEQIKRQNQSNREKKMRRLIKANFIPDDLWNTLKYPKGTRIPLEGVREHLKDFLIALRKEYKKRGEPLKFIKRMEIGEQGGIHIHILVNRLKNAQTDLIIQQCWQQGSVNHESIYEHGGYKKLANYIVKLPDEEMEGQLSFFPEEERKELVSYSTSRNLIRPEPERTEYRRWTVRDLIENGPKPTPGYYIDKDSIHYGVNPYTGMSYYHYTEYRIEEINSRSSPPWKEGTWK
ncbi:rolling circle replication-associated protein [Anaerocolumna chitinilytica]|uniref:Replication-associated protein ORF2/G2P domain-containing protein n=1 Tax=Anaerocolumna chitinilytica TaxID=1727145 RepID=A0A7M3SA19_9FIRM|nr:hypothetical protein [Anaerocolumna chitinilytica]BCK01437.1 hypothetical protein bsdcttw_44770 [Anaerocolumna chitinilytica]